MSDTNLTEGYENLTAAAAIQRIKRASKEDLPKLEELENQRSESRASVTKALAERRATLDTGVGEPDAPQAPDQPTTDTDATRTATSSGDQPATDAGDPPVTVASEETDDTSDPRVVTADQHEARAIDSARIEDVGDSDHEVPDPSADLDDLPDINADPGDATQIVSELAARRAADDDTDEPWEGYDQLEEDEVLEELNNQDSVTLARTRFYETERGDERQAIVDAIDQRLRAVRASEKVFRLPHDPREQARLLKDTLEGEDDYGPGDHRDEIEKIVHDLEEDDPKRPFFEGGLQDQADRSQLGEVADPTAIPPNARYLVNRDPVEAAQFQESLISASPDDLGQREALAQAGAERLRAEVAMTRDNGDETMSSTHAVASVCAEEHIPFPFQHPTPEQTVDASDARTNDSREWQKERARQIAKRLGEVLVPEAADETPDPPGTTEVVPRGQGEPTRDVARAPTLRGIDESGPFTSGINIGAAVSRQDAAHDFVGIVTDVDPNLQLGLVEVTFPNEEEPQWLNILNVRFEGDGLAVLAREEAAGRSG